MEIRAGKRYDESQLRTVDFARMVRGTGEILGKILKKQVILVIFHHFHCESTFIIVENEI